MQSWKFGRTLRNAADPLWHALFWPPARYSRSGKTYRAVCGAQVRIPVDQESGVGGRKCKACERAIGSFEIGRSGDKG